MQVRDRVKELRRVPAADLRKNPRNWRKHGEAQTAALRAMLSEIGFAGALLARELPDGSLELIDGHLRTDLTSDATVPVLVLDLTETESHKLLLTFDPIAAMAEADNDALKSLMDEWKTDNPALQALFDHTAKEYDVLVGNEAPLEEPPAQIDKAAEFQKKWETRLGQLWQIGEHKLLCADARVGASYQQLSNRPINLLASSPPYTDQRSYKLGEFNWLSLMKEVTKESLPLLAEGGNALFVLGLSHKERAVDSYWQPWLEYCAQLGWPLFGWYVWDKQHGKPGDWNGRLAPAHEFVFHFNISKTTVRKWIKTLDSAGVDATFRQKDGSLKRATSPDKIGQPYKIPDSVIRMTNEQSRGVHTQSHPAVYPVALPAFFIETWTDPKESVLDPFCGSGTTLIAAHQLGRVGYGIEIDPGYVAVTLERLSLLGLTPKLINGPTV